MVDHKAIVSAADRFYVVRKIFTASAPIMKMGGITRDFEIQLSGWENQTGSGGRYQGISK